MITIWTRKLLSLFLVSLFLFLPCATCSASSYQISDEELTQLEQILASQEKSLTRALMLLGEQDSELTTLRQELQAALDELTTSKQEVQILKESLDTALNSIDAANQSLREYEREVKSQTNRLKRQRNLGFATAAIIAGAFIRK